MNLSHSIQAKEKKISNNWIINCVLLRLGVLSIVAKLYLVFLLSCSGTLVLLDGEIPTLQQRDKMECRNIATNLNWVL